MQPESLAELNQPGVYMSLSLELYGPYDRIADFANDCTVLRDAVKQVAVEWGPMPEQIEFEWEDTKETVRMSISLRNQVQMNWTTEQMIEQTYVWLDEDSRHSGSVYSGVDGPDDEAAPEAPSAPESPDAVPAVPEESDVPEAPETVSAKPVAVAPVIQMRMF